MIDPIIYGLLEMSLLVVSLLILIWSMIGLTKTLGYLMLPTRKDPNGQRDSIFSFRTDEKHTG